MKRNVRKSLMNLANMSMFQNKFPTSNAIMLMFPIKLKVKNAPMSMSLFIPKCLKKSATISLFPSATKFLRKSATKFPKKNFR